MKTELLTIQEIDRATDLLNKGELVAVPTETVYGLAADAMNDAAIQKIFIAKGRPSDHPLIVHIDSMQKLSDWAADIPENAKKLAQKFWPGPLTIILKKQDSVSHLITGGLPTVAVRVPNHPATLALIKKMPRGIVAPSANAHKKTSPTKPEHVFKTLGGKIAAVLDGGACSVGIESTIVDMTKQTPIILRPGAITAAMIEQVLKMNIESPLMHDQKVAGNMKIHYQPEKPLFLLTLDEIENYPEENAVAVMHYSPITKKTNATYYKMPPHIADYASALYETLHYIDTTLVEKIIVEMPPSLSEWSAIRDRLVKAAFK